MAVAPSPTPTVEGPVVLAAPARSSAVPRETKTAYPAHETLVRAFVERSNGELGWLAWHDGSAAIVVERQPGGPLHPMAIAEFPEAPQEALVLERGRGIGPWSLWCRARGIRSCMVVPVRARHKVVGTIGIASCVAGALSDDDLQRLLLVASLAVSTRHYETRLAGLRQLFDEVSRTLENALALDKALQLPPTYRDIARSVGESLDASYCQIAIRDAAGALTIRAAGGHRPPRQAGAVAWPLADLTQCAAALRHRRAVVLSFGSRDPRTEPERQALFTPTTRNGVLLPFVVGPRTQGVLIIGEERQSRFQPLSPERVAILELVASRIAHIMRMSRRLEYERTGERRRQRQLTVERQRLARDVHDEIGQALSALLVHVRFAMSQGHAGPDELKIVEETAKRALDGARALAYGFRHMERGIAPLEEARAFAETMVRAARCELTWFQERDGAKVAAGTLREVSRVIKESVRNIVQHSRAKQVRVRIEYPDGRIRVIIRDDGVGFSLRDARPAEDGRGMGLVGSSERLARLGGVFDVRSSPKRGTTVIIDAPRK
jgi:signal transduction histidine kinase